MKILHQLTEAVVLKETDYTTKGFSTTLRVGQAVLSEVDLSCKLGYDKKTISRVLDKMNQLGIVTSTQSNRTSVHTLKCVSAWMLDGNRIDNPFYVRIKDRQEEGEDDCRQTEAMNEGCVSDSDFSFAGKMPVISDNGEIPSSLISVSSQPTAEEDSIEDVSVDSHI